LQLLAFLVGSSLNVPGTCSIRWANKVDTDLYYISESKSNGATHHWSEQNLLVAPDILCDLFTWLYILLLPTSVSFYLLICSSDEYSYAVNKYVISSPWHTSIDTGIQHTTFITERTS
jgi:hypothetical protein